MSRGYGKYRRGAAHSHASFHFDSLFKENSNKPSAARSTATVGKWGITSFTSIRTVNGLNRSAEKRPSEECVLKPKKFFKSRNNDTSNTKQTTYSNQPIDYENSSKKSTFDNPAKLEKPASPRKFFSSKNTEKTVLSSNINHLKAAETKPPIVLRIFRGKSQLVNDSDDSEGAPTTPTATVPPTSPKTPRAEAATSPRVLRETSQPPRSSNCRITRSARRSMQQDPSGSPATGDTAVEFSLFTSPKEEVEFSPQYIPAEKYELERKAMYDNLLRPNTPEEEEEEAQNDLFDIQKETGGFIEEDPVKQDTLEENVSQVEDDEYSIDLPEVPEPIDTSESADDKQILMESEKLLDQTAVDFTKTTKIIIKPIRKPSFSKEWSDSESNSPIHENELATPIHDDQLVEDKCEAELREVEVEKDDEILEQAPVKLVISKKKGSIFKSRALVSDGSKKRRALYKHKWSDDKEGAQKNPEAPVVQGDVFDDFEFQGNSLEKVLVPAAEDDVEDLTKVTCSKSDKGYYTVVRNVKKAHQMQEIGEFQEFNDDVEYILDTLQDNNPISTRCLSAISLASKCMVPAFRMHVRAHGTVTKFFRALHDATKDQSLGLCTATVMFVLSQDRLNMDLDRDCLELMLSLLESDVSYQQALDVCGLSSAQLEKNKQKVKELCAEIQSQGHAMHLNLDLITVGQLAMETLLSLTSKRAGEWFKEELRELGGLEHIMKTICECCRQVSDYVASWTEVLLDKLKKVDRCLRVLENVTHNNEENQSYLLNYNNGVILDTLVNLYKLCDREIPLYPVTDITDKESTGTIIREALLVTLKLLINLTHHFNRKSMGSALIGKRTGVIETSLHLLLQVPHYIPDQKKFELGVLVLMLLINLIQENEANQKLLLDAKAPSRLESIYSREESAVEALITQFYHWEGCAKIAEKRTNAILDGEKDTETEKTTYKSNEEFIEETVAKLLQKAGTHMEYTFLASYIVMLIGFLIMQNIDYQNNVRQYLRGNNFADMVELLNKFFNFMKMTASTEASNVCAVKTTERIIKFLEECDKPNTSENETYAECMDLSYTMAH